MVQIWEIYMNIHLPQIPYDLHPARVGLLSLSNAYPASAWKTPVKGVHIFSLTLGILTLNLSPFLFILFLLYAWIFHQVSMLAKAA